MIFRGKNINEYTVEDVQSLIENKVPESKILDYKRELQFDEKAKVEFIYDVSSFYNTEGGCIVVGLDEEKDEEKKEFEVADIKVKNRKNEKRTINKLIDAFSELRIEFEQKQQELSELLTKSKLEQGEGINKEIMDNALMQTEVSIKSIQKNIDGSNLILEGAIKKLHWKITNENRIIGGFNCRKAVAQVFDSVYVFAFYTDEITIPGGPCSINGLPGLILGMTIPRLYTSWIATKVMVNDVDVSIIKPVQTKKPYTLDALGALIAERMKDWYSDDAQENKEIQEQKARNLWILLL